jgi:hypothetical protein
VIERAPPAPSIERAPPTPSIERAPPAPTIERAPPAPAIERAPTRAPEVEPPRRAAPEIAAPPASTPGTSLPTPVETPRIERRDSPATPYDPTAPIDLDAARKRAGQLAREGTGRRAVLPFPMPPVPDRKTKMETAIEKARKPDCRTAYKDLGLLAIAPLVANEFGEGTCRW